MGQTSKLRPKSAPARTPARVCTHEPVRSVSRVSLCPAADEKLTATVTKATLHPAGETSRSYRRVIDTRPSCQWIACRGGQMPCRSVQCGQTSSGVPVYVARALDPAFNKCLGTFRPSTGRCHIYWNGKELSTDIYEVLCFRPNTTMTHIHSRVVTSQSHQTIREQTTDHMFHRPVKMSLFTPVKTTCMQYINHSVRHDRTSELENVLKVQTIANPLKIVRQKRHHNKR